MKTTNDLTGILKKADPDTVSDALRECGDRLVGSDRPFADYLRQQLRARGLRQQDVFLAADIPEGYGYKLISGQKRTRRRDVILRLCLAAQLSLDELQRALQLYGLAPLYARLPRDAVLMIAVNSGLHEAAAVNELLSAHGLEPLAPCGPVERD